MPPRWGAAVTGLVLALLALPAAAAAAPPAIPRLPGLPGAPPGITIPHVDQQSWLMTVRATSGSSWSGYGTQILGDCDETVGLHGSEDLEFDTPKAEEVTGTAVGSLTSFSGSVHVKGNVGRRADGFDRWTCPEKSLTLQSVTDGCGTHPFSGIASMLVDTRTKTMTVALQPTTSAASTALDHCKPGFGPLYPGLLEAKASVKLKQLFSDADVLRFHGTATRLISEQQLFVPIRGGARVDWYVELFPVGGDPTAVPGSYKPVLRGGTLRLDGSRSKARHGRIVEYKWTFAPGAGCPPGTQLRNATKNGQRVSVKLLCAVVATLTVKDSRGRTDARSTRLGVNPRKGKPWQTPFAHREELATGARGPTAPPAVSHPGGAVAVSLTGGVNTTDCGEEAPGSMILCPTIGGPGSWRGKGYELQKVSDPQGPFDGFWYVGSSSLEVKRVALINPTLTPGVPGYPNRGSFYDENLGRGNPVADFLNAVKQHEGYGKPGVAKSGHTEIIHDLVTGSRDPRKKAETLFAPSERAAQDEVDKELHAIDDEVDKASDDPLPQIWNTGPLVFWDEGANAWVQAATFHVP